MATELEPAFLLTAYAQGVFPMADERGHIAWVDPDPRAVLPLDRFHVSKNLRRRCTSGRFTITIDQDFPDVITQCANRKEGTWISHEIASAYTRLYEIGAAHSVETREDGVLVGGLYGVSLGGAFFGESMFHHRTDASKVALVHLVERLNERRFTLLDVQFMTPHLARFGAVEIPRAEYLDRLESALSRRRRFAD